MFDKHDNLFSKTDEGGSDYRGTVYEMLHAKGSWAESALYNLDGSGGHSSDGGVVLDNVGNLYGIASQGGACGQGVVHEVTLS